MEAARRLAGPGLTSEDSRNPPEVDTEYSTEDIDLLIKCYMAGNVMKGIPQNVELTKKQVRDLVLTERTAIYFDEEFSRSFDFKVIGEMIDNYLNDTSLRNINALYHKYRVTMSIDKKINDEASVHAEFLSIGNSEAKNLLRMREPEKL